MESIEKHIEVDKKILDDPMISAQARRHTQEELKSLEKWAQEHPEDHHDPTALELYCNENPDASECKIYDD
jgi:hypothetical protein